MKVYYSDVFELPLPSGHRFPMSKYRLLRERVLQMAKDTDTIAAAPAATDEQLALVHDRGYLQRVFAGMLAASEVRRLGFPWSPQLVRRSRRSTGATIAAARAALSEGVAVNLAGGTHHAFADCGEGYCVFNDVAVALRVLQQERLVRRAVVIDCDVHQGNGTAAIFADDSDVFTFSLHGGRNFPYHKVPSDLDFAVPDGTSDQPYLHWLEAALGLLPLSGAECVFYLAGADPYEHDRMGRLKLSRSGLERRDRLTLAFCRQRELPVVVVMAGGYAHQVHDIVEIHAATVRAASDFSNWATSSQSARTAADGPPR